MKHIRIISISFLALLICHFSYGQGGKLLYERANKALEKQDYATAIELLEKSVDKGYPEAQCRLGQCYYDGQGVSKNYNTAFFLFEKSAEQGCASAEYYLGHCYYEGDGVAQNHVKAAEWFRKAAEQGHADAQYRYGLCCYESDGVAKNSTTASEWFEKAANQGHAEAQYYIGLCYYDGLGRILDYDTAAKWFGKSAEQGYAEAQYRYGLCYYDGLGRILDYDTAAKWFGKSAEQGYAPAEYYLGLCYYEGQGVPQDYSKAFEWFGKSAEQGYAEAQYRYGLCYYEGHGADTNSYKAAEWFEKAAQRGYADAQYNIGLCYYMGQGVAKNYDTAAKWFEKAAKQGHAEAQYYIGLCYYEGHGVLYVNHYMAAEWFRKAAEQGHADAQYRYGLCCYEGDGLVRNSATDLEWFEKAAKWFEKAANQGHAEAQYRYGLCWYEGRGKARSYNKAKEWLGKSAEQGCVMAQSLFRLLNKADEYFKSKNDRVFFVNTIADTANPILYYFELDQEKGIIGVKACNLLTLSNVSVPYERYDCSLNELSAQNAQFYLLSDCYFLVQVKQKSEANSLFLMLNTSKKQISQITPKYGQCDYRMELKNLSFSLQNRKTSTSFYYDLPIVMPKQFCGKLVEDIKAYEKKNEEERRIAEQRRTQEEQRKAEEERRKVAAHYGYDDDGVPYPQYVDLGLPSGTKWKSSNESALPCSYEKAIKTYGDKLPTKEQFEELITNCKWIWDGKGFTVKGPNGQSIYMPAAGCSYIGDERTTHSVGEGGYYWSSTRYGSSARCLYFYSDGVYIYYHNLRFGQSVRLVQD